MQTIINFINLIIIGLKKKFPNFLKARAIVLAYYAALLSIVV